MNKKMIREWKKVYLSDLGYIIYELKDLIKTPALIILEGDLGAGKTTFTQQFAGDKDILSPTYSLLSESRNVLHADFYRLEKAEDIIPLELSLYLENKQYFFVEWGLKYARRILREIPEEFNPFLIEITINENVSDSGEGLSRNFILSFLQED
jgi:tRNA threonylcarbamoyladenosine biosynthesis protein TsaE